jgi:hypothetical protein
MDICEVASKVVGIFAVFWLDSYKMRRTFRIRSLGSGGKAAGPYSVCKARVTSNPRLPGLPAPESRTVLEWNNWVLGAKEEVL